MKRILMRLLFLGWCVLWVRVGFPWRGFSWTPTFRRLRVIPFVGGTLGPQLLNIVAFVPLGIIGMGLGWRPRSVVLVGFGLSALTELIQLFSTTRYPSMTDLILNTLGVTIGVLIGMGWRGIEPPRSGRSATIDSRPT